MTKKKLTTSKEKYDYLIKRYYSDIVSGVKTKENLLFERSLHAILELQECEEIYLKDKKRNSNGGLFIERRKLQYWANPLINLGKNGLHAELNLAPVETGIAAQCFKFFSKIWTPSDR